MSLDTQFKHILSHNYSSIHLRILLRLRIAPDSDNIQDITEFQITIYLSDDDRHTR